MRFILLMIAALHATRNFSTSNALQTTTLCESHQKQTLVCEESNPYIDIVSVELLSACEVKGDSCKLPITAGSLLSDRCNRYNQKILQLCQGQRDECVLSYTSLITDDQANTPWRNPGCNTKAVKAFTVEYRCSNEESLQLQANVISLVKLCAAISNSATATTNSHAEDILLPPSMTRTELNAPTATTAPNISTVGRHAGHVSTATSRVLEVDDVSIVVITGILLAGLLLLTLITITIVLLCRRRKQRSKAGKKNYPSLPPGLESEFDVKKKRPHAGYHDGFDVLFDKKNYNGSSRRNNKSNSHEEKCQPCLDRGHFECQGHSLSRNGSSKKSKDRKNLTFLVPSGYYEHVKGQTDELSEGHVYSKLSDASTKLTSLPAEPVTDMSNHYDHLHLASSGNPQKEQEENAYDKPEDYYEELHPFSLAKADRYEELSTAVPEVAPPRPAEDMIGIYDNVSSALPHKM